MDRRFGIRRIRLIYLTVALLMSIVGKTYGQNIQKLKKKEYCLYSAYKIRDMETAEMIEEDFAMNGWNYPGIIRKQADSFLINNPIAYGSDEYAEYIKEGKSNEIRKLLKSKKFPVWRVMALLGYDTRDRKGVFNQLNFFEKKLYGLYLYDSVLHIAVYDTATNEMELLASVNDEINFKRFYNNFQIIQGNNRVLIINEINSRFIIIELEHKKIYQGKIPKPFETAEIVGFSGDFIYLIENASYTVGELNFQTMGVKSLGKLSYNVPFRKDTTIKYFFDPEKKQVYVTTLDLVKICLTANVYQL